jgi:hypothetical protein
VRDISHNLHRVYGTEVGPDTISAITDEVLDEVKVWQHRPLDEVHPIVYVDANQHAARCRPDRQPEVRPYTKDMSRVGAVAITASPTVNASRPDSGTRTTNREVRSTRAATAVSPALLMTTSASRWPGTCRSSFCQPVV